MLEVSGKELQTQAMDHHGLTAGVCKDLKISKLIDARFSIDSQRKVSPGKAVVAMLLNGLGFTNRRLYLTSQFFANKPVERLLDAPISAEDLTDYTLGHALDNISKYGASKLFAEVAFDIALENNLLGVLNHIDTTSLSVHGAYDVKDEPHIVEIKHGFSKDHRPDLKQVVLSLTVNGPSHFPLWMEPLDGNSSDKESFHDTIKKVEDFKKQLNLEKNFKWVADAALYTKDKLLKNNDYLWLTHVPETINEAKRLIEIGYENVDWQTCEKGYKIAPFTSDYGGVEQRWLLVHSDQAEKRERKTLEKNLTKKDEALKKELWHLGNELFKCEKDAEKSLEKIKKKHKLHAIESHVSPVMKYAGRGKPKVGEEKIISGYKIESIFSRNIELIEKLINSKGRFILATNDLDPIKYPDEYMLHEYKDQQSVEGGFRFLKDPWFMVDSVFLKLPSRIEALMMVMTLCLMVYNVAQYRLRESLKEKSETLPNQLGKEVKTPTLRWIFQMMEGIGIIRFFEEHIDKPLKEFVTNLNQLRKKIIFLMGENVCHMYGLYQEWQDWKNKSQGLGV